MKTRTLQVADGRPAKYQPAYARESVFGIVIAWEAAVALCESKDVKLEDIPDPVTSAELVKLGFTIDRRKEP